VTSYLWEKLTFMCGTYFKMLNYSNHVCFRKATPFYNLYDCVIISLLSMTPQHPIYLDADVASVCMWRRCHRSKIKFDQWVESDLDNLCFFVNVKNLAQFDLYELLETHCWFMPAFLSHVRV
jgi:hypothetical protein